jgi:hypothetical protein
MVMKKVLAKMVKGILHPNLVIILFFEWVGRFLQDKPYLELQYRLHTGAKLDLDNPKTFNEKIQWLKLYSRKPEYTHMADKYEARRYISEKVGSKYLIPLFGVWDSFSNIDFALLPNQFVLKCNHDSQGLVICKNKEQLNMKKARKKIENRLKQNYYYGGREWVYKDIKPRILAEKYLADESGSELKDYKLFCCNGEPKIIQVDFNRFTGHKRNFYSPLWEYQPVALLYQPHPEIAVPKPKPLKKMLDLAKILSEGIPFLRTDFYVVDEKIYVGELTFYPEDGYGKFLTPEWNNVFGDWIVLPEEKRSVSNEQSHRIIDFLFGKS